MKLRSRRALTATLAAATLIGVGGITSASAAVTTTAIRSCVNKAGAVRIVTTNTCRAGEKPLSWNQRGPAGTKGATGARGAAGARGPAGPVGPRGEPGPSAGSGIVTGRCLHLIPKTAKAGDQIELNCKHEATFNYGSVMLTPMDGSMSEAYAQYTLRLGWDYSYAIVWDGGDANNLVIRVHILRNIVSPFPTPDTDSYALDFTYLAAGSPAN